MPTSLPRLPDHLEARLLQFDAAWNQPSLEQLRAACPAEADEAYLLELIQIDARKRKAAGKTVDEALYLEAFPVLHEDAALLQNVRAITFTPLQTGDSVLRALAATTPVLHQVNLPSADPQATTSEPPSPTKLPEQRYKLGGEIARGGMGAVLRGRDEDLGREIAVKVMLQTHYGKTELLQRFVEEAQIAGQLQHPGVTPVYELGQFPDQRPYFTMKLVRGTTLAKLLKDRTDPASERPRFLKIFEQICQTMAYAHTRRVIHRDLKPHNIMVGSFGEVQVMDWGLAKVLTAPGESGADSAQRVEIPQATEGSVQTRRSSGNSTDIPNTQAGSVLGTPAYMAPEQARGNVDHLDERADVFGLGAILCEILTGRPPYVGTDGMEVYRKAVDADLADAIAQLERCGADAELIALTQRCLSASCEERPRDAIVLANQLSEYLNGVEQRLKHAELAAVEARTMVVEEQKRRRLTFRLAAGILTAILAGLTVSLWQMSRAMTAEGIARTNEDKALRLASSEKAANEQTQRRLIQIEKGVDLLAGMLTGLNPRNEEKGGPPLFQQLRDRATRAADELDAESVGDPMVVARLQTVLGNTLIDLGNTEKAIEVLEKARSTRERLLGADHHETLFSMNSLANGYLDAGKLEQALRLKEKNLLLTKNKLGADHPDTLASMGNLAMGYKAAGKLDLALPLYEEAFKQNKAKLGADHPQTLTSMNNLANGYVVAGNLVRALPLLEESLRLAKARLGADHAETLISMSNLAVGYQAAGKLEQALQLKEETLKVSKARFGADHPDTLLSMNNLASAYHAAGKLHLALPLYEETLKLRKAKRGADHPDTLATMGNLATGYQAAGMQEKALLLHEETFLLKKAKLGAEHHETLISMGNLAGSYRAAGKMALALPLYEETFRLMKAKQGVDHPHTLTSMNNLAVGYQAAGKLDQAVPLLEEVLKLSKAKLGADHPDTLYQMNNLAMAYLVTNKLDLALPLFRQAAAGIERRQFRDEIAVRIISSTAAAHERAKQFVEAETWRRKLLAVVQKQAGNESVAYASELASLGLNLMKQQKWDSAESTLRECLAIRDRKDPDDWRAYQTKSLLGGTLLGQKKYAEAEPLMLAGYAGMKKHVRRIPQPALPRLPEALDLLIQLYTETSRPDEVKKWKAEKEKLAKPASGGK